MRNLLCLIFLLIFSSLGICDSENTIGGYTASPHLIQVSGDTLTPSPYLNFTGSVTGSTINGITNINIDGGGTASNITGLVSAGTNVTLGGSGTFASPYVVNSFGSGTVTSSGSPVSGNISKFTTATNIAPAAYSDIVGLWSGCSGTQYLGANGNCYSAAGSGTVTSVTFTGDGIVDSSTPSSAVTTSGTVTATALTQAKNTALAGPTSGSNASPTFRALVGADLPNPAASTLGGVESIAAVSHNFLTSISTSGVPAQAQPAQADITGLTTGSSPTFTGLTISGLTASEIVGTDSSSDLVSLATSTYPSLTELSYSKGVTSAIQTQLNSKGTSSAVGANPTASVGTSAVNGSSSNFMRADGAPSIDQTMTPTWTGNHIFNASPVSLVTGGNVGINSANPGNTLDVKGTIRTDNFTLSGNGAAAGFILQTSSGVGIGTWVPAPTGGGSGTITSSTANYVGYYTGATTINGGSAFQFNGTNVGIGTFPNTEALQILGNVGINTLTAPSGGSNNLTIFGNVGIGTGFVGGAGEGALTVMNGNVGIGTWTPTGTLQVGNGTNACTSGNNCFGGNVGIGTTVPTGALEVEGANVGVGTAVSPDTLTVQGSLLFRGNLAGGVTGNIGIGTTVTGAGATCDSSCNTASKRCMFGIVTATANIEPCSVSIIGDCVCLPAT